jgi:hypothetical protein
MTRLPLALLLALLMAPQASAAGLLSTTVDASDAHAGTCLAPATGAGVVRRAVVTHGNGLVRARLEAAEGDWDVAVLDAGGKLVAGSAHAGADELAEGFVAAGRALTVQACRRDGGAGSARLSVENVVLPAAAPGRLQLVRVFLASAAEKDLLLALGLDLTEHGRPGFLDVLLHGDEDLRVLERSGLRFETLIADVAAADRTVSRAAAGPPGTMPSGRVQYRRLPEFSEDMKKLANENPGLVRLITLPHPTLEGRPVEGLEITENVSARDGKPVFLNVGVHHAREWPSAEMTLEWAFELVNTYKAGNERTTGLLKRARVIVVPIVNPDGFNLSREEVVDGGSSQTDVGFAYKRKNCRMEDGALPAPGECGAEANRSKGTDPNRNYGGFWGGPGASSSPTSDTYRGSGPFSEPETQNIKALVSSNQVATLITNHTYADLILRPPGKQSSPPPPDEALLKELADAMAVENGYTSQHGYDLYDTSGSTEDWSYYATGGLGYTFEIGRLDNLQGGGAVTGAGFHPPYPTGVVAEWFGKYPTGGGNREAYYLALESTADERRHAVLTGRAVPGATIRVRKAFTSIAAGRSFDEVLESTLEVPASGAFEFHVNQSTRPLVAGESTEAWTVSCEHDGRVLGRQDVVVARGERKDVGAMCASAVSSPPGAVTPALLLKVSPRRTSLRSLRRRGLAARVTCSARCDLNVRLSRGGRRAGAATRRGVTSATVRVKLTRAAAARLRRANRATLRLRVVATGAGGPAAVTRTVRVRK